MFKFYSNAFSRATRGAAGFLFTIALLLIGFGVLIMALPEIFALLAATIFFIAGASCAVLAIKIFLASRKLHQYDSDHNSKYGGERIHELDDFDG